MARKKVETEEVLDKSVEATTRTEKDSEASDEELETEENLGASKEEPETEKGISGKYRIVCCNPINEAFGGVRFYDGVAYTNDSFTASWFRNKEGYVVEKE